MEASDFQAIMRSAHHFAQVCGYEWNSQYSLPGQLVEVGVLFRSREEQLEFDKWIPAELDTNARMGSVLMRVSGNIRTYAYHVTAMHYDIGDALCLQTQTHYLVNPIRPYEDELLKDFNSGDVFYVRWEVDDLGMFTAHPDRLPITALYDIGFGPSAKQVLYLDNGDTKLPLFAVSAK